jgi:hypothetical protein
LESQGTGGHLYHLFQRSHQEGEKSFPISLQGGPEHQYCKHHKDGPFFPSFVEEEGNKYLFSKVTEVELKEMLLNMQKY